MNISEEIKIKVKTKKLKLIIWIAAILIAAIKIIAVTLGVSRTAKAKRVENQLSLGEKIRILRWRGYYES